MKDKVIQFVKDFIYMAIIVSIAEFIVYKLNIVNEFSFSYIAVFMIGWSIWQIAKMYIDNKKNKI